MLKPADLKKMTFHHDHNYLCAFLNAVAERGRYGLPWTKAARKLGIQPASLLNQCKKWERDGLWDRIDMTLTDESIKKWVKMGRLLERDRLPSVRQEQLDAVTARENERKAQIAAARAETERVQWMKDRLCEGAVGEDGRVYKRSKLNWTADTPYLHNKSYKESSKLNPLPLGVGVIEEFTYADGTVKPFKFYWIPGVKYSVEIPAAYR